MPGSNDHLSEEQRAHLRSLADQAKEEIASERTAGDPPESFGKPTPEQEAMISELEAKVRQIEEHEVGGYTLPTPPAPDAVGEDGEDERPEVKAFLVFQDPDGSGRWIANSEVEKVLSQIIPLDCEVDDIRRGASEVLEDVRTMINTQSILQGQMAIAQQMAEQRQTQTIAQGLDLGGNRAQRRAARR